MYRSELSNILCGLLSNFFAYRIFLKPSSLKCSRKIFHNTMQNVKIYQKEAQFGFSINVDDFDKVHVTSEIELDKVPWQIKVAKRMSNGEGVIDLFLVCQPAVLANTQKWSCEANMTATLRSVSSNQSFRQSLTKVVFKKGKESQGFKPFIKLADLDPYKRNGQVFFEIQLSVNPIKTQSQTQILQKRSIFQFTLNDVSKFNTKHSVDVYVGGTKWSVFIKKWKPDSDIPSDYLGFFLCDERSSQDENWTWHVKCSFKLLSFDDNVGSYTRRIERTFYSKGDDWGFTKFIAWDIFMNPVNKYIQDDKAVFEVDLEVSPAKELWNFNREQLQPSVGLMECSICLQSVVEREPVTTKCGHLFCNECIKRSIEINQKCPNCNADAVLLDLRPIYP